MNIPVFSAATALVVHVVLLVPLIGIVKIGIYSLVFATAFYAIIVVFVNYYFVNKYVFFNMEWKQNVWVPVASAILMGIVAFLVYEGLDWILNMVAGAYISNAVAVFGAIVIAAGSYFIAMIKIGGYTKEMLVTFPKGALLAHIAVKLHLVKE